MYSAQVVAETLDLGLLGEIPQDEMIYRALLKHMSPMEVECEGRRAMERCAAQDGAGGAVAELWQGGEGLAVPPVSSESEGDEAPMMVENRRSPGAL